MPDELDLDSTGYDEPPIQSDDDLVDPETGDLIAAAEGDAPIEEPVAAEPVVAPAVAAQPAPVVAAATPAAPDAQPSATSPYAGGMTQEERDKANLLFDNDQLAFMQSEIRKAVQQDRQARAQLVTEAKRLGVTDDYMREYGSEIDEIEPTLDPALRGTRNGALLATQLVIAKRVAAGADYREEIRKQNELLNGKPVAVTVTAPAAPASTPRAQVQPTPAAAVVSRASVTAVGGPPSQQRTGITRAQQRMNKFHEIIGVGPNE